MQLVEKINKIPSGRMLVPLFLCAGINTIFPNFFTCSVYIENLFGSPAVTTYMCLTLLFTGIQMRINELPAALKIGGTHVFTKYAIGACFYIIIANKFGMDGIFGVCSLALLCSLTNCNGSMYMGLMEEYGDREDMAARPMFNLNSGPGLSLVTIGVSGQVKLSPLVYLGVFFPILLGMILSFIDPSIRDRAKNGTKLLLPLMSGAMGARINLLDIISAGFGGIVLFVLVFLVTGPVALFVDRVLLKRPGYTGMATVSVAANTIAVPAMIAQAVPDFAPYVATAVLQISGAVILSVLITPIVVHQTAKKWGCVKQKNIYKIESSIS
ncbi:MAG: 2-keto-3-deoxygluconate permease [Lachnospiraceae bacterium]|nr:2-keto-3-deoxygluconate permease [Lachnospiraceae bacterium]